MKTLVLTVIAGFGILAILFIFAFNAHSTPLPADPWEPPVTIVWGITELGPGPVRIRGAYFDWPYHTTMWGDFQIRRLVAAERFLHEALRERVVETPEPMTAVLLGSGLLGIVVMRRKGR